MGKIDLNYLVSHQKDTKMPNLEGEVTFLDGRGKAFLWRLGALNVETNAIEVGYTEVSKSHLFVRLTMASHVVLRILLANFDTKKESIKNLFVKRNILYGFRKETLTWTALF